MNKLVNLCATILVALALVACGSPGEDPADAAAKAAADGGIVTTPTTPEPPVAKQAADVTFVNVPTDPSKTSIISGERDVEVAAMRILQGESPAWIGQLVFKNQLAPVDLRETFKSFTLMDSLGNNVKGEAPYVVNYDEKDQLVIVDFPQSSWLPSDFGVATPKVYSLLASTSPSVADGTVFAFKLIAVQLHNYGATSEIDEVGGEPFEVANVAGVHLPIITTTSPGYITVPDHLIGTTVKVGSITASCPAENKELWCVFVQARYTAYGASSPSLESGGLEFGSNPNGYPEYDRYTSNDIWHYLSPGQTLVFTISAWVYQTNVMVHVDDMVWVVGRRKVNPIVPTGSAACGLLVGDKDKCKG